VVSTLREAESGQRGFILTQNPEFAESVERALGSARREAATLARLTADNPTQNTRARQIETLVGERIAILQASARLTGNGNFVAARDFVATGRGLMLMQLVDGKIGDLVLDERDLAATRMDKVERLLRVILWLAAVGTPLTLLFLVMMARSLIRRIRQPAGAMIEVMGQLGAGERKARITGDMGSSEFSQLAQGYNAMADELELALADQVKAHDNLEAANDALSHNAQTLRERGEVIEILGGMAHRMQAARTDEELAAIIRVFVPRVLPHIPGALYVHNNSRNLLVATATWGGLELAQGNFAPEECWALRRGQSHFVDEPGSDIVCPHVGSQTDHYHCEPLLAGGEVIGVLYLKGTIDTENRFRLAVLSENIASALVNHRLQRGCANRPSAIPSPGCSTAATWKRRCRSKSRAPRARARRSAWSCAMSTTSSASTTNSATTQAIRSCRP
jgi:CHASE3 domain sensor protein